MPLYKSPKSGKLIEVESDFDTETGTDRAREEAISKGWRPVHQVVSKSGKSINVDDDGLDEALSKGWMIPQVRDAKRAKVGIGAGESAARGLAQGLTLNGADELQALVRAPFSKKSYSELRDDYRGGDDAAEDEQFGAFLGSNLTGAVAGGAGAAAKGGLKGLVKAGAAMGAVGGFGAGEGDALSQAGSTAAGAALGAAAPVAIRGLEKAAGAAVRAGKGAAKEAVSLGSDLNREAIDYYLANPQAVRNARPLEDVARDVVSGLDQAKGKLQAYSQQSRDVLNRQGLGMEKAGIVERLREEAGAMMRKAKTPEMAADARALEEQAAFLESLPGDAFSPDDLKDLLIQLGDKAYATNVKAGGFVTPLEQGLRNVRGDVDEGVKWLSSDFKDTMAKAAEGARTLENVRPRFDTPDKALNALKGIARERSPFQKENLQALDEYLGKDLATQARASGVADAFDARTTNGSRNVNLGGRIGEAAGGFGNAIGAVIGYAKDTMARPAAKASLDFAVAAEPVIAQAGRFAAPLAEAAKKGPAAFMLTHNLLLQSQPEYRALVEGQSRP
jgi:hypothetical protein